MGAPEYVPASSSPVRTYSSPPRRAGSWTADRPGELEGRQPEGGRLGTPGPDAGYALSLAARLRGRLHLLDGEHEADALAGAAAIGMKRAGLFGRAPVLHDVQAGLVVWGFLDDPADADLAELRRELFAEIHHVHHYELLRHVADAVPADLLRQSLDDIEVAHAELGIAALDLGGA
jgi:hypothetical protein